MGEAGLSGFPIFSLLHRRIMGEMIRIFLLCVVLLLTLIVLGRGVQMRELLVSLNMGAGEFLLVLLYMSPIFMLLVIPLSCMLSIFISMLRMSADREMVALKAGGVSLMQILPAPMYMAVLCCVCTLFISIHGISWGGEHFRSTLLNLARDKAQVNLQPGVFNQDIRGLTVFARRIDPKTKAMQQIIVDDFSKGQGENITILAPFGSIVTDNRRGNLVFILHDGRIYRLYGDSVSVLDFDQYNIRISLEKLFSNFEMGEIKPKEMPWKQLLYIDEDLGGGTAYDYGKASEAEPSLAFSGMPKDFFKRLNLFNGDLRKVFPNESEDFIAKVKTWMDEVYLRYKLKIKTEIQKRLSLPVSSLVLAIFAIPLAVGFEGASRQLGVVMVLCSFMLYYFLYSLGLTLGESGFLSPLITVWMANVVFLLGGVSGFIFIARKGTLDISFEYGNILKKLKLFAAKLHEHT
jgi:lipopolysaccharide export system permease protein